MRSVSVEAVDRPVTLGGNGHAGIFVPTVRRLTGRALSRLLPESFPCLSDSEYVRSTGGGKLIMLGGSFLLSLNSEC